ncbi:hypothetical protein [Microbacterium schleiferi]|uniref:hypothetical protein n=1 Tax=Microbacterium schleiferi TaxID=69362 RepID=UPI001D176C9D|nr:hypothetical protein [Microbacterium schleiferi]MCC4266273.1 hypothetical protein [Microbacterium schleiferi]
MRFPLRYGVGVLKSGKWVEAGEDSAPEGAMRDAAVLRAEGMYARAFDWSVGPAGLILDPQPGDREYRADITRMERQP